MLGISGGVDSSYLAYQASKLGLRTLLVHVDTGWNSELAVSNIEKLVRNLKLDLVTHVVDWEEMQDLQHAFLRAGVPNQDIPQDHAISAAFSNCAASYRVPWSFEGTNLACEGVLPAAWGYDNKDLTHILDIHRRFGSRPLRAFPTMSYARHALRHQLCRRIKVAKPLNLLPYRKADAIRTLESEIGWRYYGGKHYESRFTKFFQGWYLPSKWGYDKRLAHLSSLIASGQMTREEALEEFTAGVLPAAEIEADRQYMINKLGVTPEEFEGLMRVPNTPHQAYAQTPRLLKAFFSGGDRILRMVRVEPGSTWLRRSCA
jgi:hypothetical protein